MARHRALRARVRRGVAKWPLVIVVLVLVLLLGWGGWTWISGLVAQRAAAQAGACTQGTASLRIAVTPAVATAIRDIAQRWTSTRPVVYDHCITVDVQSIDSQQVLAGLTQGWDEARLGPHPQAWLPDSTLWANRLAAQNHGLIGSTPESVATSPVLLAMPQAGAEAVRTTSAFRWSDLAALTSDPDGWARFGKPEWGAFKVAMPDPATNPPTAMALQSALAGASPQGAGPVTVDVLAMQPVKDVMSRLAAAKPAGGPQTTDDALARLANSNDATSAGFAAVPVFEVDLYRHDTGQDTGAPPLRQLYGVAAGGPNPVADFPFLALAGPGVDEAQGRAAQRFRDFLKEPAQQKSLAQVGLRTDDTQDLPKPSPALRWAATTENLVAADANTTQQISAAWSSADNGGQAVTMLVGVSQSMGGDGGGGRSKLDWLRAALTGQVNRSVAGSLGLWEFSRSLDGDQSYKQLVPTGPVGDQRDALLAGIGALQPSGDSHLYASVLAAYQYATQHYQAGKRNRIVVITDSANDGGLSYAQLRGQVDQLRSADKPVQISAVAIGKAPDRGQLGELTRLTGGTLSVVDDGRGIDPALGQLLSAGG